MLVNCLEMKFQVGFFHVLLIQTVLHLGRTFHNYTCSIMFLDKSHTNKWYCTYVYDEETQDLDVNLQNFVSERTSKALSWRAQCSFLLAWISWFILFNHLLILMYPIGNKLSKCTKTCEKTLRIHRGNLTSLLSVLIQNLMTTSCFSLLVDISFAVDLWICGVLLPWR